MPPYHRLDGGRLGLRVLAERGPVRLLCFPHAGGQALVYRPLANHLPDGYSVAAVDPPGHGFLDSRPLDTVDALVDACLRHVPAEWLDGAVLVGHSMGGYAALGLADALLRAGRRPRALVLAASRPPHQRDQYTSLASLDDEALFGTLVRMGGMPENPRDARTLFQWAHVPLRADLAAFDRYTPPEAPLPVPLLALGAWDDPFVKPPHVAEWSRYATPTQHALLPGGHLFLLSQAAEYAARIARFVQSQSISGDA